MNRITRKFLKYSFIILLLITFKIIPVIGEVEVFAANNVLYIISDEHNPLFSEPYGNTTVSTPNMNWIKNNGTMFRNAYCPSPLCVPSRSSMLTGLRVSDIGIYNNTILQTYPSFLSYGKALADQGVYSCYVGRVDGYNYNNDYGFSQMLDVSNNQRLPGDDSFLRSPLLYEAGSSDRQTEYGVETNPYNGDIGKVSSADTWIRGTGLNKTNNNEPWVLTVGILEPHHPQYTTQDRWDAVSGDLPTYDDTYATANHPYAQDLRNFFETDQYNTNNILGLRRGYRADINFTDEQIGILIDALSDTGQLDNTNIIYISDHGEMAGEFGMYFKSSLYEDSVRIPCLATGPDFPVNVICSTPVDTHDAIASAFAATGTTKPSGWVGTPLQTIANAQYDSQRVVFSEYMGKGTRGGAFMIRKGDWKLIYNTEADHQLFNLQNDPHELNNIYSTNTLKAAELVAELLNICDPEEEDAKAFSLQDIQYEERVRTKVLSNPQFAPTVTTVKKVDGTVVSSEVKLLGENFQDANYTGWTDPNNTGNWTIANDSSDAANKVLNHISSTAEDRIYFNSGTAWSDYYVEARFNANTTWNSTGKIGIIGRYNTSNGYYYSAYLDYNAGTPKLKLKKYASGGDVLIQSVNYSLSSTDTSTHLIKMKFVGSAIKVFIDDVKLIEATDTELTAGTVGCFAKNQQAVFDNIFVRTYSEFGTVAVNDEIIIVFGQYMDPSTITTANVVVKDQNNNVISYTGYYNAVKKEYRINFTSNLVNNTHYKINAGSASSYYGVSATVPFEVSFTITP